VPTLCIPNDWKDAGITVATDDERRLEWLKRCVAPAVERLTDHFGTAIVLDALGLNAVIDTLEGQQDTISLQALLLAGTINTVLAPVTAEGISLN